MEKNIITGLDLGTTKVSVVIAEQVNNGFNILGFSSVKSEGLTKGLVANIPKTAEAIKQAIEIASNRAGIPITKINVGVAGEHISTMTLRNYVTISNPEKEIKNEDLQRLKDDVKTVVIASERQILHIIPIEFMVDNGLIVDDPIGMSGSKLEATNFVVLASSVAIENINRSVERAGYKVDKYILQPIASCLSVLEESEKDLGVILIDIGGGTTDVAVYQNKSLRYTKVFPIAGNILTNDIKQTIGIVKEDAERLKIDYGYATEEAIIKDQEIPIFGGRARGNINVPISLLTQIINLRMKELFTFINNDIMSEKLKNNIKAGIVLTGGGALLRGTQELAEEVFGLPARIGIPLEFNGKLPADIEKPEFATVAGLIRLLPGIFEDTAPKFEEVVEQKTKNKTKSKFGDLFTKFRELLDDL